VRAPGAVPTAVKVPPPAITVVILAEVGAAVRSGAGLEDDEGEDGESAVEDDPACLWWLFPTVPPTTPPMTAARMMRAIRAMMIFARVLAQIEVVRL